MMDYCETGFEGRLEEGARLNALILENLGKVKANA